MWPHRSHILAPLTAKTGAPKKGEKPPPFQWTLEMQKAFNQMKALMAADVLCAYPDHNKPFHIFTDASDYQLGACIMQEGKPVAYYSKKLNSAQMNCATIDKELICVVATCEFHSMLLGAELHVHTEHKNILSIGHSSQQGLCWISYVHEYGLEIHYVEGPCNVIADTFSRLLRSGLSSPLVGKKAANVAINSESDNRNESSHSLLMDDKGITVCLMNLPCFPSRKKKEGRPTKCRKCSKMMLSHIYDLTVEQCYLNLPENMVEDNPLDLENIEERQNHDGNSCSQQLSIHIGIVARLSTMLTTSCVTLNRVIIQPTGKLHYLKT
jgi:hypothetical protein